MDKMAAVESAAMSGDNMKAGGPFKQSLIVLEKKVRNLEKRKSKLDSYKEMKAKGEELNKDQKEAVEKYEVVIQNLDFARDMHKQFLTISSDAEKQVKKQAKRERAEKQQAESLRLQDVLRLQNILDLLGSEKLREDLLAGKYPNLVLTSDNLLQLDEFYQLIVPSREVVETTFNEAVQSSAEHLQAYLDRLEKKVAATTYKELRDVIERIDASGCFTVNQDSPADVSAPAASSTSATEHRTVSAEPDSVADEDSESGGVIQADDDSMTDPHGVADPPRSSLPSSYLPVAGERFDVNGTTGNAQSTETTVHPGGISAEMLSAAREFLPVQQQQDQWISSSHHQSTLMAAAAQDSLYAPGRGGGVMSGGVGGSGLVPSGLSITSTQQQHQPHINATLPTASVGSNSYNMYVAAAAAAAGVDIYGRQRPLQEIVSSMQGASFNFLQESQIELDNDPAIVAAVRPASNPQVTTGPAAYQHSGPSGSVPSQSMGHRSTGATHGESTAGPIPGLAHPSPVHFVDHEQIYHQQQQLQQLQQMQQLQQHQQHQEYLDAQQSYGVSGRHGDSNGPAAAAYVMEQQASGYPQEMRGGTTNPVSVGAGVTAGSNSPYSFMDHPQQQPQQLNFQSSQIMAETSHQSVNQSTGPHPTNNPANHGIAPPPSQRPSSSSHALEQGYTQAGVSVSQPVMNVSGPPPGIAGFAIEAGVPVNKSLSSSMVGGTMNSTTNSKPQAAAIHGSGGVVGPESGAEDVGDTSQLATVVATRTFAQTAGGAGSQQFKGTATSYSDSSANNSRGGSSFNRGGGPASGGGRSSGPPSNVNVGSGRGGMVGGAAKEQYGGNNGMPKIAGDRVGAGGPPYNNSGRGGQGGGYANGAGYNGARGGGGSGGGSNRGGPSTGSRGAHDGGSYNSPTYPHRGGGGGASRGGGGAQSGPRGGGGGFNRPNAGQSMAQHSNA